MSDASSPWPVERVEPEAVGLCSRRLGRVGDLMRRYVDDGLVAGVITLAARRGRIAHLECFGSMDLERGRPMREDAIFRIYSMTKIVTSVAGELRIYTTTVPAAGRRACLMQDPVYRIDVAHAAMGYYQVPMTSYDIASGARPGSAAPRD